LKRITNESGDTKTPGIRTRVLRIRGKETGMKKSPTRKVVATAGVVGKWEKEEP